MHTDLVSAIEEGLVTEKDDEKARARLLSEKYDWDVNLARKIWAFGMPPDGLTNILCDGTKAAQYLHEVSNMTILCPSSLRRFSTRPSITICIFIS